MQYKTVCSCSCTTANENQIIICFSLRNRTLNAGDRLRVDLRRKNVPAAKMAILEQKFDENKAFGKLKPTAINSAISNTDEADNVGQIRTTTSRLVKRSASASVRKPQTLDVQSKFSSRTSHNKTVGVICMKSGTREM